MDRKKELSNIRRLQSLKEKKQERNVQAKQIKISLCSLDSKLGASNKKIVFQSDDESDHAKEGLQNGSKKTEERSTMQLFDSDGEDSGGDDDDVNRFRLKPHLQQQKKLEFFEAVGDERFQLKDIFMEDMEEEQEQIAESDDEKDEKQKNLEILQSVLGFQLPKTIPPSPTAKKMKKYVHYNPDDEESSKYLRKAETKAEKTVEKEDNIPAEPQVSPVRYFEVSADLKNVLEGTEGEFRISNMFGYDDDDKPDEANDEEFTKSSTSHMEKSPQLNHSNTKSKKPANEKTDSLSLMSTVETGGSEQHQKFFILPGDTRLTEGVQFFKREKTEEQIRDDFLKAREVVLDILKQRHRRGIRAHRVPKNNKNKKR